MIVNTSFKINAQTVLAGLKTRKMFSRADKGKNKKDTVIGDVWIESSDGCDMMCAETGGEILRYPITPLTKRKWYKAKTDVTRLSLLAQCSDGELQLHKETCPKVISVRVTEDEYGQLESDAKACNLTLSDYCRRQLANKRPNMALNSETRKAVIGIHRHMTNYTNALRAAYNSIPSSERIKWIVEGVAWKEYRKLAIQTFRYLDKLINKE